MRVVVTGAAGFIGSTLVDRLLREGHQVVGIDNLSTGVPANLDDARTEFGPSRRFTFVQGDIQAPELGHVVTGSNPDVIYHLAAQVNLRASIADPQFDARSNVLGTINVLEAARRADVGRIVYAASGGSRYGAPERLPVTESTRPDPISPYAVAKLAGEMYLRAYAEMYGLSQISLALANVYGPRQNPHGEAGVITVFGRALLTGGEATIFGDGSASRDYVYVDDVVDAFVRAGMAPRDTAGTYNIGTGVQATVSEVHSLIADVVGSSESPCYGPPNSGELQAIALDTTRARADLGWTPRVDLVDGIGRTVAWLQQALAPKSAELVGA
jgi:UDP-glucose 4-epimerase